MPKKTIKLRVHKSGSSYSYVITIPKDLVELALKWKKGDSLIVEEIDYKGVKGVFVRRVNEE